MLVGIALGLALGGVGSWLLGRVGEAGSGPRADAAAARARADEIAKRVAQLDAALEAALAHPGPSLVEVVTDPMLI